MRNWQQHRAVYQLQLQSNHNYCYLAILRSNREYQLMILMNRHSTTFYSRSSVVCSSSRCAKPVNRSSTHHPPYSTPCTMDLNFSMRKTLLSALPVPPARLLPHPIWQVSSDGNKGENFYRTTAFTNFRHLHAAFFPNLKSPTRREWKIGKYSFQFYNQFIDLEKCLKDLVKLVSWISLVLLPPSLTNQAQCNTSTPATAAGVES